MRQLGGLVDEEILDDDAFHAAQGCLHVHGVRVGLGDVFALHEDALELPVDRAIEHVRDAQTGFCLNGGAPQFLEHFAGGVIAHVAIAREFVGERAHVTRTLHVVLSAQWVHADTVAAEVAGGHRQVGHAHHHGGALAVLGDTESVVDRRVAAGGIETSSCAHLGGRNARVGLHRLGAVFLTRHELAPQGVIHRLAALLDELFVNQTFGDNDVRHRIDQGDVGAGTQLQEVRGLHVGCANQVDLARVGNDQLGAFAQALLHARGEHGVSVRRVGTDEKNDVGVLHRLEILGAGRSTERVLQSETGG